MWSGRAVLVVLVFWACLVAFGLQAAHRGLATLTTEWQARLAPP